MVKNKNFIILLVIMLFICLFPVNAFADDYEMDCNDSVLSSVKELYPDYADNLSCSTGEYKLKLKVKLVKECTVQTTGLGAKTTTCSVNMTNDNSHDIGFIETVNDTTTRAYIAGTSTVYSSKQMEMHDVDINITNGRVVVTGVMANSDNAWNTIYSKYKVFINGAAGVGALTCVVAFVLNAVKLGAAAGNPGERRNAMKGLLFSGIGTAILGGAVIFFSMFYNAL